MTAAVACRVGHQTFEARTRNISRGGVFLETDWVFDPTGEIRMAIDLPGGTVSATGRATRFIAERNPHRLGIAVQFLE